MSFRNLLHLMKLQNFFPKPQATSTAEDRCLKILMQVILWSRQDLQDLRHAWTHDHSLGFPNHVKHFLDHWLLCNASLQEASGAFSLHFASVIAGTPTDSKKLPMCSKKNTFGKGKGSFSSSKYHLNHNFCFIKFTLFVSSVPRLCM